MANVIQFTPRAELDAEENLGAFVALCRNELTVFGKDLRFDDDVWVVTEALNLKARNTDSRLVFSEWDTVKSVVPEMMSEPFLSFAKAYMRYQHAMRPTKSVGSRLAALRALEAALSENGGGSKPSATTIQTLDRAAQLIQDHFTKAVAYRVGGQLEMLAGFLTKKQLVTVPMSWRSPIIRPRDSVRVGKEFDRRRQEKLPSAAALDALAKVFNLATEPSDVLVSSIAAILCSAPDRINEVLHLEVDCEVTQEVPSSGRAAYGLRWRPSKGAEPMVKWLIASMESVVRRALVNIRGLTEHARIVARWYEEHPRELYLPAGLEHFRHRERLSLQEIGDVLFESHAGRSTVKNWCRANGVPLLKEGGKLSGAFADVEKAVLAMLPQGFPIADAERGLKYSNALCVLQRNALHADKGTYRSVVYLLGQGDVANRLGVRSTTGIPSIFDRFGFVEDDGSRIHIRSHQFRHYLNTLAQIGGLSQLDIAKWSGRVDVRQNEVYNHQSDRDVNALVRQVTGDGSRISAPLATARNATLIPRDQFGQLKIATAHTTEYGYCVHDYTMLPCQLYRDCMNCTEQVCVKGDAAKEANIRQLVAETRTLLENAQAAESEGDFGANRWVAHQKLTLSRTEQLCAILEDPQVPDGTAIRLHGIIPASQLEQSLAQRRLGRSKAMAEGGAAASLLTHEAES
jgi:hypothetical protein